MKVFKIASLVHNFTAYVTIFWIYSEIVLQTIFALFFWNITADSFQKSSYRFLTSGYRYHIFRELILETPRREYVF